MLGHLSRRQCLILPFCKNRVSVLHSLFSLSGGRGQLLKRGRNICDTVFKGHKTSNASRQGSRQTQDCPGRPGKQSSHIKRLQNPHRRRNTSNRYRRAAHNAHKRSPGFNQTRICLYPIIHLAQKLCALLVYQAHHRQKLLANADFQRVRG